MELLWGRKWKDSRNTRKRIIGQKPEINRKKGRGGFFCQASLTAAKTFPIFNMKLI